MRSLKNIARIAGLGYLIIFVSGFFANFFVLEGLLVGGDATATTDNIMSNLFQFRLGVVGFVVMIVVDVLMAYPLYLLLKSTNKQLALFAAWLRLVNGAIFAVAIFNLFGILHLLSGADYLQVFEESHMQAQVMIWLEAFNYTWLLGLVFFGLHLLLVGYLVFRSPYLPRILGLLLLIAALGYLIDSFAQFLLADYASYQGLFEMIVVIPSVVGEFSLTLWLLIKGVRSPQRSKFQSPIRTA